MREWCYWCEAALCLVVLSASPNWGSNRILDPNEVFFVPECDGECEPYGSWGDSSCPGGICCYNQDGFKLGGFRQFDSLLGTNNFCDPTPASEPWNKIRWPDSPPICPNEADVTFRIHRPESSESDSEMGTLYGWKDAGRGVDPRRRLHLVIHGYFDDETHTTWMQRTCRTLNFVTGEVCIRVEWGMADIRNETTTRPRAVGLLRKLLGLEFGANKFPFDSFDVMRLVARVTVLFISRLEGVGEGDMCLVASNINCIGHSLGAHICGFIGKLFQRIYKCDMEKITALDPGGVQFERSGRLVNPICRLARGDAACVSVLHTSSWYLEQGIRAGMGVGLTAPIGQLDFYVDCGRQPNYCANFLGMLYNHLLNPKYTLMDRLKETLVCAHMAAVHIHMESITHDCYRGVDCGTRECSKFEAGQCNTSLVYPYGTATCSRGTVGTTGPPAVIHMGLRDRSVFCAGIDTTKYQRVDSIFG